VSLRLNDDLNRTVLLPGGPARRIVSLAPDVTENLFAIGAGAAVVGVTTADTYPPQVNTLTRVGAFGQPDYERIRALRPDLILAASATMPPAQADLLGKRLGGLPVYVQIVKQYADVPRHLLQLGQLTGQVAAAKRIAVQMQSEAAQAARRTAGRPRVSVFVEVNASPLYAAGPGSFIDDLIRRAGGRNIVTGSNPFPLYSKEALLAADPEHYVIAVGSDMGADAMTSVPASLPPSLAQRLRAVRSGNVHRIPADLLERATPRLAQGLTLLTRALHP